MNFDKLNPRQLKKRLREAHIHGIALDIDDTLSHTDHHWIDQMSTQFGNPERFTRNQIIEKYKWIEAVPYWNTKKAKALIQHLIHSDKFQENIPLIKDANHTVNKIDKIVPVVAYITARPTVVFNGTKKWLTKHGFPPAPIVLRPLRIGFTTRSEWKARALIDLYPQVRGIIDDNPDMAKDLSKFRYKGTLFLYDSGRSLKPYKNLVRCKSWSEVFKKVKRAQKTINSEASSSSTKKRE